MTGAAAGISLDGFVGAPMEVAVAGSGQADRYRFQLTAVADDHVILTPADLRARGVVRRLRQATDVTLGCGVASGWLTGTANVVGRVDDASGAMAVTLPHFERQQRRAAYRVAAALPVLAEVPGSKSGQPEPGMTLDVSAGGLAFRFERKVTPPAEGSLIAVCLRLPDAPLMAVAKLHEPGPRSERASFTQILDQDRDRIAAFVSATSVHQRRGE